MRTFIAIDFPREIMNEIEKIQKELKKKQIFHGKLTEKENLHLTLKFLGEVQEEKIEEIKIKLKEIKLSKFKAGFGEIGVFNPKFMRIIWIHILGGKILELQKLIDEKLKDLFKPEERFMSHLTIARIKNVKDKKLFMDELGKIKIPNLDFPVDKFILFSSELKPEGPEYKVIEEFLLV